MSAEAWAEERYLQAFRDQDGDLSWRLLACDVRHFNQVLAVPDTQSIGAVLSGVRGERIVAVVDEVDGDPVIELVKIVRLQ